MASKKEDSTEAVGVNTLKEEPKVKFMLFKSDRDNSPKFVAVNGRSYLIKRGVEVELPVSVYEVLKNSQAQISYADTVMDDLKNTEYTG